MGTSTQWLQFWRTEIPRQAMTKWWRFKPDWLPVGVYITRSGNRNITNTK
ncbi:MAG: hypothetical protein JOS17DRAFT_789755 [Linnemannia elongata]|nr:MAG: hypothetical protein JOS17DRAFT_789755 [Linnemannia elongata]